MAVRSKQKNFKVYSGIAVDEVVVNGIPVMRRRSDDWFNATQMLKAAGLEKARRTRVLEAEIQKCDHTKIQGGCGKYQGTWVPYDIGVYISRKYGIEEDVLPILKRAGNAGSASPTGMTAPDAKNTTAARYPPTTIHTGNSGEQLSVQQSSCNKSAPHQRHVEPPITRKRRRDVEGGSDDGNQLEENDSEGDDEMETSTDTDTDRERGDEVSRTRRAHVNYDSSRTSTETGSGCAYATGRHVGDGVSCRTRMQRYNRLMARRRRWAGELLEHFYSDNDGIPRLFIEVPDGFDVDTAIDADGHTSLHWAAALGRHRVVRHIVQSSHADASARNNRGQTALMRSVSYANGYITRGFGDILSLLQETIPALDGDDRNVLHHVADTASDSPMAPAAKYYMEQIRTLILADPQFYVETLNTPDSRGETPLMIAVRNRNETLASLLLSMGCEASSMEARSLAPWDYTDEYRIDPAHRLQPDRATSRTTIVRRSRNELPLTPYPAFHPDVNGNASSQMPVEHQHEVYEIIQQAVAPLTALVNERFDRIERQLADIYFVINLDRSIGNV